MKTKLLILTLLFVSSVVFPQKNKEIGQDNKNLLVLSPAAAFHESPSGFVSWTLGNTVMTLKIIQDELISSEIEEIDFNISAYPIPSIEKLNVSHNSKENLILTIHDLYGRELIRKQMVNQVNQINVQNLPPALYVVLIRNSKDQMVKTFKIIKH